MTSSLGASEWRRGAACALVAPRYALQPLPPPPPPCCHAPRAAGPWASNLLPRRRRQLPLPAVSPLHGAPIRAPALSPRHHTASFYLCLACPSPNSLHAPLSLLECVDCAGLPLPTPTASSHGPARGPNRALPPGTPPLQQRQRRGHCRQAGSTCGWPVTLRLLLLCNVRPALRSGSCRPDAFPTDARHPTFLAPPRCRTRAAEGQGCGGRQRNYSSSGSGRHGRQEVQRWCDLGGEQALG